ncbi:MAG: adenylate/guanylate cyclase domain-containing protein [Burkholderiaceae bacterium]|nr:adenylate/guanylate cyclase domain-containing protein [Burkholderiaceae bacterium]
MHCQACNALNADSNRFCESCGAGLALACQACGYACGPAAKFCGGCGTALGRAFPVPPTTSPAKAPVASWGELKQATVLFADIVSSTEQVANLGPEEAMERLQPALTTMCEAVERFGGTVVRTMGDGVMALFGVPSALEGHALLACEAALNMQQSFRQNPHGFAIRVGLHSGLVASDPVNAGVTRERGAHGVAIHLASRVIAMAMPGSVCITQDCVALVRAAARVQSMGRHVLKGIADAVEVYTLLSLNTTTADLHFHQAALSPFLGREGEIAELQDALVGAERAETRVIGISGAPGTGKSRLCYEFSRRCRGRSIPVFEVRAQLYGHATPLQPILELMRICFFGITSDDTESVARSRIVDTLGGIQGRTTGDEALLFEFLGLLPPDIPPCSLDSKSRHARLLQLTRAMVRQWTVPSVIFFEDLHWMDEASAAFLTAIVEAVASTRTLLILNYRPSYKAQYTGLNFTEIALAELSSPDIEELVHKLVSHRKELQAVCKLIARRSAGNPFFAEELVRAVAESGVFSSRPGQMQASPDAIEQALPATVQAVLGERIDRLGAEEKALLQICAVVGKDIPAAVAYELAGTDAAETAHHLDSLCRAALLQTMPVMGGRGYTFRHPLIQEVAYSGQLKSRRASLHAKVAAALASWCGSSLDEHAALIAYHYEAAGKKVEAANFEARAARWIHASDSGQAVRHWFRVRDLLRDVARSPQVDTLRVMLGSNMGNLAWREGIPHGDVLPLIDGAIDHANAVDARAVQLLHLGRGRMHWAAGGNADDYVDHVRQALALIDPDDIGRTAAVNAFHCQALAWAGLFNEALKANDSALATAHAIERADHDYIGFNVEHWLLGLRLRLLIRLGRFEEVEEISLSLRGVLNSTRDPIIKMIVHYMFVESGYFGKNSDLATYHALQLKELSKQFQSPYLNAYAQSCAGLGAVASGDHKLARACFVGALAVIRESKVAPELESEVLAHHALCLLRTRSVQAAFHVAEEAIVVAQQRGNRFSECLSLLVLGRALLISKNEGDALMAAGHLSRANHLLGQTGARVLESLFVDPILSSGGAQRLLGRPSVAAHQ